MKRLYIFNNYLHNGKGGEVGDMLKQLKIKRSVQVALLALRGRGVWNIFEKADKIFFFVNFNLFLAIVKIC